MLEWYHTTHIPTALPQSHAPTAAEESSGGCFNQIPRSPWKQAAHLLSHIFKVKGRATEGPLSHSVSSFLNSFRYAKDYASRGALRAEFVVWLVRWTHEGSVGFCLRQSIRNRPHSLPPSQHLNDKWLLFPLLLSVPEPIATRSRPSSGCSLTPSFPSRAGHVRVKQAANPENCNSCLIPFWKWRNVGGQTKTKRVRVAFITPTPSYASHTW